jgi:hypothetical protein
LEGSNHGLIRVLSWHLHIGLRKIMDISTKITDVAAQILTGYFSNTVLEYYHYTSLLDDAM